ncbi:hypothetical protein [Agreia sp. Leaf244]|uniref:hypothetical protein n=1 Tax=Agreia sp. Leaf244 TaxID=1736305 RepID=UPI000A86082A|nr:hypothetical protein [Agreia sp. Leaf244]
MSDIEHDDFIADARRYASQASYDVQKLPEDSIERQALHNLVSAIDSLIQAVDPN